jgi:hypothetical protein
VEVQREKLKGEVLVEARGKNKNRNMQVKSDFI